MHAHARPAIGRNRHHVNRYFFLAYCQESESGLRERQLIMVDHNQYSLAGVVELIKQIVLIIFLIEIIGGIILTFYIMRYYDSFSEALLNGMFMSVSATTNAGFDITGFFHAPLFQ